jgi:hypothetical protein
MLEYLAQIGEAEPTHSTLNAIITLLDGDQDGLRLRGKPPPKHHSKSSTVQSIENHATEYRRAIEDNPALRSNIIQIIKRQGRPGITRQIHSPPQYPEIVQAQILCIFGRPLTTTEFEVVAAYLADQNPYIPLFPTHLTQHKAPRDKWLNENWALMYETITKLGLQKEVRSLIGIASE